MNEILDLAKDFEATSKQQVSAIEQRLHQEFARHAASISAALGSSEQNINGAIDDQRRRLSALVLKSWVWLGLSLVTVLIVSWGVLWMQGTMIAANWQTMVRGFRYTTILTTLKFIF